LNYFLVV
jgi:hypothetical protein